MQVRTWFGAFTIDGNRIIDVELFNKDIDSIVKLLVEEPLLMRGKVAGADIRDLALKCGFAQSTGEYDRLLHEVSIALAKKQAAKAATPERQVIAVIEAIDDVDETSNILAGRLKELYLLDFNETPLGGEELAHHITGMENEGKTAGADLKIIQTLASNLMGLYAARAAMEESLKENMPSIAPNLTNIAGHMLGARLLSIAGSLEKLASMPSSTVQVIGAGNALFKHLKGRAPSPKHGLIFRHPLVSSAPKKLRGRIARALASKIALAARYDCYSGELKESLVHELEVKVEDIKRRHSRFTI